MCPPRSSIGGSIAAATRREHPESDVGTDARTLWDEATWREEQYAAADLLIGPPARGDLRLLGLHRRMAVTGRWWDHVDQIAHRIAELHDAHPDQAAATVRPSVVSISAQAVPEPGTLLLGSFLSTAGLAGWGFRRLGRKKQ